jgi:bifunctional lysine-specific demethylase and histidyl-hydroxylase NO66
VLTRLVEPAVTAEVFATKVWGREPLLNPGAWSDVEPPFSLAAADELLAVRGLRTPFLRLVRDGAVLEPRTYARGGGKGATVADQVDPELVLRRLAEGATVVFQALHRLWPAVGQLARGLVDDLGHPVQVNAYLTPEGAQGFASHYDTHDVFVVQLAGEKRWLVHAPVVADPGEGESWTDRRAAVESAAAGVPELDHLMRAGDVLYLPRGWLHGARAGVAGPSLHLTVGVHPYTSRDVVDVVVDEVRRGLRRTSLPAGLDPDDDELAAGLLAAARAELSAALDALDPAVVREGLRRLRQRDVPAEPVAPVAQVLLADALAAGDPVRLRAGLWPRSERAAGAVVVRWREHRVELPGEAAGAVERLLDGSVVTAAELPGLDASSALVVVRRLLREGLLVAVGAG